MSDTIYTHAIHVTTPPALCVGEEPNERRVYYGEQYTCECELCDLLQDAHEDKKFEEIEEAIALGLAKRDSTGNVYAGIHNRLFYIEPLVQEEDACNSCDNFARFINEQYQEKQLPRNYRRYPPVVNYIGTPRKDFIKIHPAEEYLVKYNIIGIDYDLKNCVRIIDRKAVATETPQEVIQAIMRHNALECDFECKKILRPKRQGNF